MIVFNTSIPTDRLLDAYNNNVVRFYSDTATASYATLSMSGFEFIRYPNGEGEFYFNFREVIPSLMNSRLFEDDIEPQIAEGAINTLTYDDSQGTYLLIPVSYSVTFTDTNIADDTLDRSYHFLLSLQQVIDFMVRGSLRPIGLQLLLPTVDGQRLNYFVRYWPGYPFDVPIFSEDDQTIEIRNVTVSQGIDVAPEGRVSRLFFCDGDQEVTIDDFLPLLTGHNLLNWRKGEQMVSLVVQKEEPTCGLYLKWRNQDGGWCHWLFSQVHGQFRNVRELPDIGRDFENLQVTRGVATTYGKSSSDSLSLLAEHLTKEDKAILDTLLESPKVYLFAGERFSRAGKFQWLEVKLPSGEFTITDYKLDIHSLRVFLELPRYTMTL